MIRQVLTLPQQLVQRRTDRRGLKWEAPVVILCGLLGAAGMAYVSNLALAAVEGENPALRYAFIGHTIQPVLVIVGAWGLYTVAPHVLSRFYDGHGPMSRLLRASAWAIVPLGVWNAVRSVTTAVAFMNKDIPANPEGLDIEVEMANILDLGYSDPVYLIGVASGVIFVAWSWLILTDGVQKAKDLPREQAQRLAAAPAAVMGLYVVYRTLSDGGLI